MRKSKEIVNNMVSIADLYELLAKIYIKLERLEESVDELVEMSDM